MLGTTLLWPLPGAEDLGLQLRKSAFDSVHFNSYLLIAQCEPRICA
jgi:hypothetical protein